MRWKISNVLFVWSWLTFLTCSSAEISETSSSVTLEQDGLSPQENSIDHTESVASKATDTVLLVGGGAGGAAAAVKLPTTTSSQHDDSLKLSSSSTPPLQSVVADVPSQTQASVHLETEPSLSTLAAHKSDAQNVATSVNADAVVSKQASEHTLQQGQIQSSSSEDASEPIVISASSTTSSQNAEKSQTAANVEADTATNDQVLKGTQADKIPSQQRQEHQHQNLKPLSSIHSENVKAETTAKRPVSHKTFGEQIEPSEISNSLTSSSVEVEPTLDLSQAPHKDDSSTPVVGVADLPAGVGGRAVELVEDAAAQKSNGEGSKTSPETMAGTQPENVDVVTDSEGDLPTFDKWSVQYLAEQEKQKIEKEAEQAGKPGIVVGHKKLRQNFAAEACGAKVVSSNAEAENVNHLLNGNPDEYMISPCKAKKWFVVELCEPVQIHRVELGTLELFSSPPKSFRVSASQRFPAKDWTSIGQFEMSGERSVQTFSTQLGEEFVKFLRVEMIDHHGNEHYCPLTTLRVLGVDMALDDEEEHELADVEGHDTDAVGNEGEADGTAQSLFSSAKDTVVKLVQKVLYKGDEERPSDEPDNGTQQAPEDSTVVTDSTTPCPIKDEGVTTSQEISSDEISSQSAQNTEDEFAGTTDEPPIITKLGEMEQLPTAKDVPVVVMLDREEDDFRHEKSRGCSRRNDLHIWRWWQQETLSVCSAERPKQEVIDKSGLKPSLTLADQQSVQGNSVVDSSASVLDGEQTSVSDVKDISPTKMRTESVSVEELTLQTGDTGQESTLTSVSTAAESNSVTDVSEASKKQQQGEDFTEQLVSTADEASLQTSSSIVSVHTANQNIPVEPTQKPVAQQGGSSQPASAPETPSLMSSQTDSSFESSYLSGEGITGKATATPGLDVIHSQAQEIDKPAVDGLSRVDPSPTMGEEMSKDDPLLIEVSHTIPATTESSQTPEQKPANTNISESVPVSEEGNGNTNSVGRAGGTRAAPDLVKVGMMGSSKRDASIMKLNNRIVALEQNVSMTKKYLEELSRAFKQQSEEMMRLHNKTEARLNSLITTTDERETEHQTAFAVLDQKVSNLSLAIEVMHIKMDTIAEELWHGQLLLGCLQALAFIWLLVQTASGTRSAQVTADQQHGTSLQSSATVAFSFAKKTDSICSEKHHNSEPQRRSSDGNMKHSRRKTNILEVDAVGCMKKQSSETNILTALANSGDVSREIISQNSKKKKKKKQRQNQSSMGVVPVGAELSSADNTPSQSPSFSSSAGVLFGATNQLSSHFVNVPFSASNNFPSCMTDLPYKTYPPYFNETKENSPVLGSRIADTPSRQPRPDPYLGCLRCMNVMIPGRQQGNVGHPAVWSFHGGVQSGLTDVYHNATSGFHTGTHSCGSHPFLDLSNAMPLQTNISHVSSSPSPQASPSVNPWSTDSPEFKFPAYRKSKIRRVSESSGETPTNSQTGISHHQPARRSLLVANSRRHRSVRNVGTSDFVNPRSGEEFFLAHNYLSENRFKFPVSPAKESGSHENALKMDSTRIMHIQDNVGSIGTQDYMKGKDIDKPKLSSEDFADTPLERGSIPQHLPHGKRIGHSQKRDAVGATQSVVATRFHPSTPSFIPLNQEPPHPSSVPLSVINSSTTKDSIPLSSKSVSKNFIAYSQANMGSTDTEKRRNTLPVGGGEKDAPKVNGSERDVADSNNRLSPPPDGACGGTVVGKKMHKSHHRRQGSNPLDYSNSIGAARPKGQSQVQGSGKSSKMKKCTSNPGIGQQGKKSSVAVKPTSSGASTNVTNV